MEKATIKSLGKALKGEFRVERDLPESMRKALQRLAATRDERADDSDIQPSGTTRVAEGQ